MPKVLNLSHEPNVRDVPVAETASNVAIWTGQTHRDNLRTKKRGNSGDFSNCLTVSNCLVLAPVHSCTDNIPGTDAKRNQRTTRVFSNRLTLSNCLVRDPAHSCSATIPGTDANKGLQVFSNRLTVSNCLVRDPVHSCMPPSRVPMLKEIKGLQEYSQTVSPSQTVSCLARPIAVLPPSRVPMLREIKGLQEYSQTVSQTVSCVTRSIAVLTTSRVPMPREIKGLQEYSQTVSPQTVSCLARPIAVLPPSRVPMPRENNGLQEYSQTVSPSQTVSRLPRISTRDWNPSRTISPSALRLSHIGVVIYLNSERRTCEG